jgi:hypothetical protein
MTSDTRRITLITSSPQAPGRCWDASPHATNRLIFVKAFTVLRHALGLGMAEMKQDVERVVLDHSSTAADYLDLLATLPSQFSGDVIMIRGDESAFLSACGRGGDRVLYALDPPDLQFYLATHGLLASDMYEERKTA